MYLEVMSKELSKYGRCSWMAGRERVWVCTGCVRGTQGGMGVTITVIGATTGTAEEQTNHGSLEMGPSGL